MADRKSSTDWILLRDARDLLAEFYQSRAPAQRLLRARLEAGDVPWRCSLLEGWKRVSDPEAGDSAFWNEYLASDDPERSSRIIVLHIDWDNSSARRGGMLGYTAFRITVPRADVEAMLPADTSAESSNVHGAGAWIAAELRRMRMAGEKLPNKLAPLARTLEGRMKKAALADPSIRPIKAKSIENGMRRDWGLWPLGRT